MVTDGQANLVDDGKIRLDLSGNKLSKRPKPFIGNSFGDFRQELLKSMTSKAFIDLAHYIPTSLIKSAGDGNNAPNAGSGDRPRRKRSQSS